MEALYPPEKKKLDPKDYEKIPVGKFVTGTIAEIQYEDNHEFKGKNAKTGPAVRFKFEIDGLKFPHYSRWMTFSYGEKTNLYLKYIVPLVEGAKPDMKFNVHRFKDLRVSMVWMNDPNNPDFQVIQLILPADEKKILPDSTEEEVPF